MGNSRFNSIGNWICSFYFCDSDYYSTLHGNILLENYGIKTRAVVTNVVNGTGRFHRACYLYEFMIGGECYTGNSLIDKSEKDRVGDSIDVLYLDFWPSTTRPTSFFE